MAALPQTTVAELAELADRHLADTWDADQPLYRWLRAIKHLTTEAKSYDKDGNTELAFIRFLTIQRLVHDILPTHPEWNQLPERNISAIQSVSSSPPQLGSPFREAAALRPTQERLKQHIYAQTLSAASPARPAPLAPGTQPALTLRHTVQPASDSMSTPTPPYSSTPAPPFSQPKLRATDKLKKKLGLGKKAPTFLAPIGEVGRPGSAPPSTAGSGGLGGVDDDEEEVCGSESGEEGWTDLGRPRPRSRSPGLERPRSRAGSGASTPGAQAYQQRPQLGPARVPSYQSQASVREEDYSAAQLAAREWRNQSRTPPATHPGQLGREGEWRDELAPGIAYAKVGAPSWDAVPVRTTYAPSSRAPTSTQSSFYNDSVPPSRASTSAASYHSQPHSQSAYSQPSRRSYDDTPYARPDGAGIQRTPSRLTSTHQKQQGFCPSLRRSARIPTRGGYGGESFPAHMPEGQSLGYSLADEAPDRSAQASTSSLTSAYLDSAQPARPSLPAAYGLPSRQPSLPPQQQSYPQQPLRPLPQPSLSYPASSSPTRLLRPLPVPPLDRPKPPPTPNSFARAHPTYPQPPPRQPTAPPRTHEQTHSYPVPLGPEPARLARSGSVSAMPFLPTERSERAVPLAVTEDGLPLRHVVIPSGLIPEFVKRAEPNTRKGIETCGLLMARLTRNVFTITHLLIPKQTGTVDTCATTHEEEQFAFQDAHDLLVVGWIHTHPQFSCFMSSLDLHTHASYQAMLAEAIAIVCSPAEEPSHGVFRLTSPVGIETIVECREPGAFHPHPDLPIYTDSNPQFGHARMRDVPFETVDLRKKSFW